MSFYVSNNPAEDCSTQNVESSCKPCWNQPETRDVGAILAVELSGADSDEYVPPGMFAKEYVPPSIFAKLLISAFHARYVCKIRVFFPV